MYDARLLSREAICRCGEEFSASTQHGDVMDATARLKDRVDLVAANLAAHAVSNDRTGRITVNQIQEIGRSGVFALTVPRSRGGVGAGIRETTEALRTFGYADPSIALILSMHYIQHLVIARSDRFPAHLARRLTQDAISGEGLINALRVEPELGSPARGGLPETTARWTPEGWRISGRKIYSTGASILSWYLVWAKTNEAEPRVGQFLVQAGLPGIRIIETWDHLGLRASGSHDVVFDDVLIPLDQAVDIRLVADWRAPDPLQASLHPVLIASIYDGVARAARDWIVGFAKSRKPAGLGAALATLPRMQEAIGTIEAMLSVNARLIGSLARDLDDGGIFPAEANIVKTAVTSNAIAVVEQALQLSSNHGLSRNNPLERHHRDVLCGRVHTPQDDSTYVSLGRKALQI